MTEGPGVVLLRCLTLSAADMIACEGTVEAFRRKLLKEKLLVIWWSFRASLLLGRLQNAEVGGPMNLDVTSSQGTSTTVQESTPFHLHWLCMRSYWKFG